MERRAGEEQNGDASGATPLPRPDLTNRQMRRKPGKLQEANILSADWSEELLKCLSKPSTDARLPPRRLESHVWHAKRMAMQDTGWGWTLPEGEPGRGRGSRAFMRTLKTGTVMHDASYWCPLLLEGPVAAVRKCLQKMMGPVWMGTVLEALEDVEQGLMREVEAVLHAVGQYPRGALGPCRIVVLPARRSPAAVDDHAPRAARVNVWAHGACASVVYDALVEAVKDAVEASVQVLALRRIELRGHGADAALGRALFASSSTSHASDGACTSLIPNYLSSLRAGEAVSRISPDPRLIKPVELGPASGSVLPPGGAPPDADLFAHTCNLAPLSEAAISHARQSLRQKLALGEEVGETGALIDNLAGQMHFPAIFVRQGQGHPGERRQVLERPWKREF